MKILAARPLKTSDTSGVAAAASIILAAGLTYDDPKAGTLTRLKSVLIPLWPRATETLIKYRKATKVKVLRDFKDWTINPPKTDKDGDDDWKFDAFVETFCTRDVVTAIKKDPGLTDAEINTLASALIWMKGGSTSAYITIQKHGYAAGMPSDVLSIIAPKATTQDKPARELAALLGKLGLKQATLAAPLRLSMEETKDLKEKKPKEHAKYLELRKSLIGSYRSELQNYIRSKNKPQPIAGVKLHLQKQGILVTTLPEGFVGLVGEKGELYTTAGKFIKHNPIGRVQMNPNYDAKTDNAYVFKYRPPGALKDQVASTVDRIGDRTTEKFDTAREMESKLEAIQAKYRRDLRGTNKEKQTLAAMLELQYATAMRIGNVGNATKNIDGTMEPTYGLSTMRVGQVYKRGSGLLITFPGKAGVIAKYTITPATPMMKKVIDRIKELLVYESGEPKNKLDYVFEDSTGRYNGVRVNKYLKTISGMPKLTNHKIRHMRGTAEARKLLAEAPMRMDQKTAEAWFLREMKAVGKLLNHVKGVGDAQEITQMTAIKNYIDPMLSLGFFKDRGLRRPKFLATLGKQ